MDTTFINELANLISIPSLTTDQRYWFVRTNSGRHYDDFIINRYIAIGWDYISLAILREKDEDFIKQTIKKTEGKKATVNDDQEVEGERGSDGRVTAIRNKILRFVKEFKIGDIILIPSKNSSEISIGMITSEVYEDCNYIASYYEENPGAETILCPYHNLNARI